MSDIVKLKPKENNKKKFLLQRKHFDIPHIICNHVVGKNHTLTHRIVAGIILMFVGVSISQAGGAVTIVVIHYGLDALGYALHGFGALPIFELLSDKVNNDGAKVEMEELKEEITAQESEKAKL